MSASPRVRTAVAPAVARCGASVLVLNPRLTNSKHRTPSCRSPAEVYFFVASKTTLLHNETPLQPGCHCGRPRRELDPAACLSAPYSADSPESATTGSLTRRCCTRRVRESSPLSGNQAATPSATVAGDPRRSASLFLDARSGYRLARRGPPATQ